MEHKIITKTGTINSRFVSAAKKQLKNEELEWISRQTSFVGGDVIETIKERVYCILGGITESPRCIECGKTTSFFTSPTNGYRNYCSKSCSDKSTIRNDNRKSTMCERYGVNNPTKNVDILSARTAANEQKYGNANPLGNVEIRQKANDTLIRKYGVNHFSRSHLSQNIIDKLNDKEWFRQLHHDDKTPAQTIANQLGVNPTTILNYLHKHNIEVKNYFSSSAETEIASFIEQMGITVTTNTRKLIPPYELDIYIPEFNIDIEYNGLYWHSE